MTWVCSFWLGKGYANAKLKTPAENFNFYLVGFKINILSILTESMKYRILLWNLTFGNLALGCEKIQMIWKKLFLTDLKTSMHFFVNNFCIIDFFRNWITLWIGLYELDSFWSILKPIFIRITQSRLFFHKIYTIVPHISGKHAPGQNTGQSRAIFLEE